MKLVMMEETIFLINASGKCKHQSYLVVSILVDVTLLMHHQFYSRKAQIGQVGIDNIKAILKFLFDALRECDVLKAIKVHI